MKSATRSGHCSAIAASATVVLSLTLGIAANTAIFFAGWDLLRAPDYREPARLVSIGEVIPKFLKSYPLVGISPSTWVRSN
jgi:hypothetical protein